MNNTDFFLNKKNIGTLFNTITHKYNLPSSENYKTALIQVIVNEMKIINSKIDHNKISSKSNNELNTALSQLNNMIIDNIKNKLPSKDNLPNRQSSNINQTVEKNSTNNSNNT